MYLNLQYIEGVSFAFALINNSFYHEVIDFIKWYFSFPFMSPDVFLFILLLSHITLLFLGLSPQLLHHHHYCIRAFASMFISDLVYNFYSYPVLVWFMFNGYSCCIKIVGEFYLFLFSDRHSIRLRLPIL